MADGIENLGHDSSNVTVWCNCLPNFKSPVFLWDQLGASCCSRNFSFQFSPLYKKKKQKNTKQNLYYIVLRLHPIKSD